MGLRLYTTYNTLRQSTHDLPTYQYDPEIFNFGWKIEIWDRDYIGSSSEIEAIGADGVVLKMEGGRSDMNKAIVPTVASFSMLINTQAEEDFLTDLTLGDEERFYIKIYHKERLKFVGYTIVDEITEDITEKNRTLNITAVDGLSPNERNKIPCTRLGG